MTGEITHSQPHVYTPYTVVSNNPTTIQRDGTERVRDLGIIRGVTDPFQLSRLQVGALVAQNYNVVVRGTFVGEKYASLKYRENVLVNIPSHELYNQTGIVVYISTQMLSTTLAIKLSDPREWLDYYRVPPPEDFIHTPVIPDPPTDVTITTQRDFVNEQTVLSALLEYKASTDAEWVEIRVRKASGVEDVWDQTLRQIVTFASDRIQRTTLLGILDGIDYVIHLYSISKSGTYSDPYVLEYNPSHDDTPPKDPTSVQAISIPGGVFVSWDELLTYFQPSAWADGTNYTTGQFVVYQGTYYKCTSDVSATTTNAPGTDTGDDHWTTELELHTTHVLDYSYTRIRITDEDDATVAERAFRTSATFFSVDNYESVKNLEIHVAHVDKSGNTSEEITVTATTGDSASGEDGDDGIGTESLFARSSIGDLTTLNASFKPDNSVGYDAGQSKTATVDGESITIEWVDKSTEVELTAENPYLLIISRAVVGIPAGNESPYTIRDAWMEGTRYFIDDYVSHEGSEFRCIREHNATPVRGPAGNNAARFWVEDRVLKSGWSVWGNIGVIGHFGLDGDDGIGTENLYAKSSIDDLTALNANFKPDNTVTYDTGQTKTGTVSGESVTIAWVDARTQVELDDENPNLLVISRAVAGVPEDGDSPYDEDNNLKPGWSEWGDIGIVGRFGIRGTQGGDGIGLERLYAKSSIDDLTELNANFKPDDDIAYDVGETITNTVSGESVTIAWVDKTTQIELDSESPHLLSVARNVVGVPENGDFSYIERSAWVSGSMYSVDDYVAYNNNEYRCIQAHTASNTILPTNTTYWVADRVRKEGWSGWGGVGIIGHYGIDGREGGDGIGLETLYARSPSTNLTRINNLFKPDNSLGYDQGQTKSGTLAGIAVDIVWEDSSNRVNLNADNPFLLAVSRSVAGVPTNNESPYSDGTTLKDGWSNWGNVGIAGYFGSDGDDGAGSEALYAKSSINDLTELNTNFKPDNSVGYDAGQSKTATVDGESITISWVDTHQQVDLDAENPYLLAIFRRVSGIPTDNESPYSAGTTLKEGWSNWGSVGIVGHFGTDGEDGADGGDGIGLESLFAKSPISDVSVLNAQFTPNDSIGYDVGQSRTATVDGESVTIAWVDKETQVELAADDPFLLTVSRSVAGVPTDAETPYMSRDAWVNGTQYSVGDYVSQGGSEYRCIRAHSATTNRSPTGIDRATYWTEDRTFKEGWTGWGGIGVIGKFGIDGERGDDGIGLENLYARSATDNLTALNNNFKPNNNIGYDVGQTRTGNVAGESVTIVWVDKETQVELTETQPYLLTIIRSVSGVPSNGETPYISQPAWVNGTQYRVGDYVSREGSEYRCIRAHTAINQRSPTGFDSAPYWVEDRTYKEGWSDWGGIGIIGRYGLDGEDGEDGVGTKGDKGDVGDDGVGFESLYARSPSPNLNRINNLFKPDNSIGYDQGQTKSGTLAGATRDIVWVDKATQVTLNADYPYLLVVSRTVAGIPTNNESPYSSGTILKSGWSNWGSAGIAGYYGDDGDDGIGAENLYAKSPTNNLTALNNNFKPDNSIGYDAGQTKTGTVSGNSVTIEWVDTRSQVELDANSPYLLTIFRTVGGVPTSNESPYSSGTTLKEGWSNWGDIGVVGRFGVDGGRGIDGIDGIDGDDGIDGNDGDDGVGLESLYARSPSSNLTRLNNVFKPANSIGYDAGQTKTGTISGNSVTIEWVDKSTQVELTQDNPYLLVISRTVEGIPTNNESPYSSGTNLKTGWSNWGNIGITGHFGDDGDDGVGLENLYAKSSTNNLTSLNSSFKPDNSVGYDSGQTKTGTVSGSSVTIQWRDLRSQVELTASEPYLLTISRTVLGIPSDGESPYSSGTTLKEGWSNWGDIGIAGHFGQDSTGQQTFYQGSRLASPLSKPSHTNAQKADSDYIPSGWSTTPPSQTANTPYIWQVTRSNIGNSSGSFGDFSDVTLFAGIAENSHYVVYRSTSSGSEPDLPIGDGWTASSVIAEKDANFNNEVLWSGSGSDPRPVPPGWQRFPTDITSTQRYRWAAGIILLNPAGGTPTWNMTNFDYSDTQSGYTYGIWLDSAVGTSTVSNRLATPAITITAGNERLTITWGSITNATGYELSYKLATSATWISVSNPSSPVTISGLTNGQRYNVRLRATTTTTGFTSSPYATTEGIPVGAAATLWHTGNLPTATGGDGRITFTGISSSTATNGYRLAYRLTYEEDTQLQSVSVAAGNTSYVLTNILNNETYFFFWFARATTTHRETSLGSGQVFVQNNSLTQLATPSLSVTAGNQSATATWGTVANASRYRILHRVDPGYWTLATNSATTSPYTISGLSNGTTYNVRIFAYPESGSSTYRRSGHRGAAVTPSATAGGSPLAAPVISATRTPNSITISWNAVTGATNGYDVQYKVATSSIWIDQSDRTSPSTISSLNIDTAYNVRVRARAVATRGASAWDEETVRTLAGPPFPTPTISLTATTSSIVVDWTDTATRQYNGYEIQYKQSSSSTWLSITLDGGPYTISGLASGTAYDVRIRISATAANEASAWATGAITTQTTSTPRLSTPVFILSTTTSTITVTWSSVSGASNGYELGYKRSSSSTWISVSDTTSPSTITGLSSNTTYNVRIRASATSSNSASTWAASTTTTDAEASALDAPSLSLTATDRAITATWSSVSGASSGYTLQYKESARSSWTTYSIDNTSPSTISSLTSNTTYNVRVRADATSSRSASSWSTETITTQAGTAQAQVPTNITLTASATTITVSWDPWSSLINTDIFHKVSSDSEYRNGIYGAGQSGGAPRKSYTITGLLSGTSYDVRIRTSAAYQYTASNWVTNSITTQSGFFGGQHQQQIITSALREEDNNVIFSWRRLPMAGKGYCVRYRKVGMGEYTYINVLQPDSDVERASITIRGLKRGTKYVFGMQIKGTDSFGSSPWYENEFTTSNNAKLNTPVLTVMTAPTNAKFSWEPVEDATSYQFQYKTTAEDDWPAVETTVTSPYTVVLEGGRYVGRLRASAPNYIDSDWRQKIFTIEGLPQPPKEVRVSPTGGTGNVSWSAVYGAIGYYVNFRVVDVYGWSHRDFRTINLSFRTGGLSSHVGKYWEARVRSIFPGGVVSEYTYKRAVIVP